MCNKGDKMPPVSSQMVQLCTDYQIKVLLMFIIHSITSYLIAFTDEKKM